MVEHTQAICRLLPTNYLSVFDHFVGLGFKRLRILWQLFWYSEGILELFPSTCMFLFRYLSVINILGMLQKPGCESIIIILNLIKHFHIKIYFSCHESNNLISPMRKLEAWNKITLVKVSKLYLNPLCLMSTKGTYIL